ncbi:MAG TPA: TatD family deoxyribonuclease [Flavobacteriales bacterium]|nr:TatD family deoxyribonuclease [Flavobacteriales bacterium]
MLIDTHTHLFLEQFAADDEQVIESAVTNGVERFYLPNIDSSTYDSMMAFVGKYPGRCYPLIGLHPCSVKEDFETELDFIREKLSKQTFNGIGETGIDLYWDKTNLDNQITAFTSQIQLAKENKLPVIIHCRESFNEVFEVISKCNDESLFGIFHCFTGSVKQAQDVISLGGFKMGIGGVLTFKNGGLDQTVKEIDLKHLVLETDSPYLAPAPYRGKRNESSYLKIIAERLAEIKEKSLEEVAAITTENANMVFCQL